MSIVVESVSAVATARSSNLTVTKPTGVVVGNLLVAVLVSVDSGAGTNNGTWSILSTWNDTTSANLGSRAGFSIQYRIATSADVSASNYTFASSQSENLRGYMLRCSGNNIAGNPLGTTGQEAEKDVVSATFTGNLTSYTPAENGALVIMQVVGSSGGPRNATVSGYTVPNVSFTEGDDSSHGDGSPALVQASAYGIQSTAAAITTYVATFSSSYDDHFGQFVLFLPPVNATGTNVLTETNTTTFTQAGTCDTIGENTLLETDTTMFAQNGTGTSPTQWTNEAKPSTTWVNETK